LKPDWLTADTAYGTGKLLAWLLGKSKTPHIAVWKFASGEHAIRQWISFQPGDCRACTLKQRCTRAPFKKIARDVNEDVRNHARSLKGTPAFERSSHARKK
jgi:hypothetical protein